MNPMLLKGAIVHFAILFRKKNQDFFPKQSSQHLNNGSFSSFFSSFLNSEANFSTRHQQDTLATLGLEKHPGGTDNETIILVQLPPGERPGGYGDLCRSVST